MRRLLQIHAPHFTAGIEVQDGRVVMTAPIIHWMEGRTEAFVMCWCDRKRWRVVEVRTEKNESLQPDLPGVN